MASTEKMPQQPSVTEQTTENSFLNETANKAESIDQEHREILDWLKNVRFKKLLFGGVNEQDVWKKLEELNDLFEAALKAERIRFEVLLEEHQKGLRNIQPTNDSEKGRDIDG